ncbi:ABC transporter permease [bacterium]|jgi:sugar transport system permease protein|nr:ABC transporter permease [bacterium]|tara:strand:+ start:1038 stop:2012 length:975 start_codon:yes stop_codon:yes gene_type:complete
MKNKSKIKVNNLHEIGLLIALISVLLIFSFSTENFFTQRNFMSILRSASYVGLVAFPMTFVLITREIDISVGPSVAWSGVFFVILIKWFEFNYTFAAIIVLFWGLFLGYFVGMARTKLMIPTFITTLALWSALRGYSLFITEGRPIAISNKPFRYFFGGDVLGLPTVTWIMLIVFLIFWFISKYTVLGTNIYAVGGNPKAARSIGLNVDRIKIITLMTTGLFSALVGILFVARVSSGNSTVGEGMEFDVIAAVVVGGTALGGAIGTMTGTLLGVLFIAMISNGLIHWGIDPDLNKVVKGIIIFLAVVINSNVTFKKNSGNKEEE